MVAAGLAVHAFAAQRLSGRRAVVERLSLSMPSASPFPSPFHVLAPIPAPVRVPVTARESSGSYGVVSAGVLEPT